MTVQLTTRLVAARPRHALLAMAGADTPPATTPADARERSRSRRRRARGPRSLCASD